MNQFESIEGKILFIIYQLYSSNQISIEQRGELKDFLISKQNLKFMNAVQSYKKSENTDQFMRFLVDYTSNDYSFVEALSVESQISMKSQQQKTITLIARQESLSTDTNQIFTYLSPTSERKTEKDISTASFRRKGKKYLTQIL